LLVLLGYLKDLSKPVEWRQTFWNLLLVDYIALLWYKLIMQSLIDQVILFGERLAELPTWKLVSFYTLLILVHIYLPEPLVFMRYLLSPVITFLLFFISWIVLRNLVRDWR
jgi:hypothetical protein